MPTKVEKDEITGKATTGHEWDGIQELDTPLPKWWVYVFYFTIVISVVIFILYPAIPGISGHTTGVLGNTARNSLTADLAMARKAQAKFLDRIRTASLDEINKDNELRQFATAGGKAAFADNCVPCHGQGGAGQRGYPSLADDVWLWGGTLAEIHKTLEVGIRFAQDSRASQMPRFGVDNVLNTKQIDDVAEYVLSLTKRSKDTAAVERGAKIYAEQCAACHGKTGAGDPKQGAPALNDQVWLYGGSKAEIVAQIANPHMGVMPTWYGRLDPTTIKMLTIYVHGLGGGK